ncbi:hypothetical protein [Candidatus Pantoea deserta]|nr:hypothetical protein [Pantoea deserta]
MSKKQHNDRLNVKNRYSGSNRYLSGLPPAGWQAAEENQLASISNHIE